MTPWGTYLMAEENFHGYFSGDLDELRDRYEARPTADDEAESNTAGDYRRASGEANYRYGVGAKLCLGRHKRFDINAGAQRGEPLRLDRRGRPLDPTSTPVKRTALGRFKHEGAECMVNQMTAASCSTPATTSASSISTNSCPHRPRRPDTTAPPTPTCWISGTLYVARFPRRRHPDLAAAGVRLERPRCHGRNGFHSQADVLIETRRAATCPGRHAHGPPRGRGAERGDQLIASTSC